jgi:tetratricopeptide (TPR) repeat protein
MKFMSARKIPGLLFAFAALGLAMPGYGQTGGVIGKAILQDGKPCAKCIILIERVGMKSMYKTKTGKKGDFVHIGLPLGDYKVTLQSPTGQTLFTTMARTAFGEPTPVDFDLKKQMAQQEHQEQQQQQQEIKKNPEVAKQVAEASKEQKQFKGLKQYFEQGNQLYDQKQYPQAIEAFQKALALAKDKNYTIVLARLADTYAKAKENDQAVATYQKAIALSPDDAPLHNNLGSLYAGMGKPTEAQAEFEKAASLDPSNASKYYFNIGAIMYNSGKMDAALTAFEKVISLDPNNADAYYLKGQALVGKATTGANGQVQAPPGTVEAFQQYLKLDPNGANAAAAKAMIATLTGTVSTQYKKSK